MRCGHCSKEIIIGDAKFCPYCSSDLSVCPNCGKRNPDEALFCMYCTAPLRASDKDVFAAQGTVAMAEPTSQVGLAKLFREKAAAEPEGNQVKPSTALYIGKTCPFCQTPFKNEAEIMLCKDCGMPHHRECWTGNGNKCTTFGCTGVAARPSDQSTHIRSTPQRARESVVIDMDATETFPTTSPASQKSGSSTSHWVWAAVVVGFMSGAYLGAGIDVGIGVGKDGAILRGVMGAVAGAGIGAGIGTTLVRVLTN